MDKNDDNAAAVCVAIDADDCPAAEEDDTPLQQHHRRRPEDYTCGLRNGAFVGMVLVTLLFIVLAAILLPRFKFNNPTPLPTPVVPSPTPTATATAPPPTTTDPATALLLMTHRVSVVWKVSLLLSSYLCFRIYTFSPTATATTIFLRVSYCFLLAYLNSGLFGPVSGMAAAHLATAYACGLLGHALADYRII